MDLTGIRKTILKGIDEAIIHIITRNGTLEELACLLEHGADILALRVNNKNIIQLFKESM